MLVAQPVMVVAQACGSTACDDGGSSLCITGNGMSCDDTDEEGTISAVRIPI